MHESIRRVWRQEPTPAVWRTLPPTLEALLAKVSDEPGERRVFAVGPLPWANLNDARQWLKSVPDGWSVDRAIDHSGSTIGGVVERISDGAKVTIVDGELWFGDAARAMTGADARECWQWLADEIAERCGGVLMFTPSTTGRDMWLRSIPGHDVWPVLSDEVSELIRSTSGQGRIEAFGDGTTTVERAFLYDARLAYLGVSRELPGALIRWDNADEFVPYVGRYRCRVRVPSDWAHVGICPRFTDAGPDWPTSGQFETWLDSSEVALAVSKRWEVKILERMIFAKARPLDPLINRLTTMLDRCGQLSEPTKRKAVRAAVRAIALHTVGALHGTPGVVSRSGETPPEGAEKIRFDRRTGLYRWAERNPIQWHQTNHPEWSSTIWARARVRLLDAPTGVRGERAGALHLERARVLAMRTDALLISGDPNWNDDGGIGRFRRVGAVGPITAPLGNGDAVQIVRQIKGAA